MTPSVDTEALTISYIGEVTVLTAGESLGFGRQSDLVIDASPFLHRVVGRFASREGFWWLQNHGGRTALSLTDDDHDGVTTVSPGQQVPLVGQRMQVRFTAGPTTYEIDLSRAGNRYRADGGAPPLGTETIDFGVVPLSADDHLLLVALCQDRLSGRSGVSTNTAIAAQLGWSITKFNRRLDSICAKLARQGVRGLRGSKGTVARSRRTALIDHALNSGLVTEHDLGLLTAAGER